MELESHFLASLSEGSLHEQSVIRREQEFLPERSERLALVLAMPRQERMTLAMLRLEPRKLETLLEWSCR